MGMKYKTKLENIWVAETLTAILATNPLQVFSVFNNCCEFSENKNVVNYLHILFLYGFNVPSKEFHCDLEIGPLVKFLESGGICEK